MELIDDIDRELANAKREASAYPDAPKAATHEAHCELEGRVAALERTTERQEVQIGENQRALNEQNAVLRKLAAQVGSLLKDRYEYATLTSRVHALERWQHTGEAPREPTREELNKTSVHVAEQRYLDQFAFANADALARLNQNAPPPADARGWPDYLGDLRNDLRYKQQVDMALGTNGYKQPGQ